MEVESNTTRHRTDSVLESIFFESGFCNKFLEGQVKNGMKKIFNYAKNCDLKQSSVSMYPGNKQKNAELKKEILPVVGCSSLFLIHLYIYAYNDIRYPCIA